MQGGLRFVHHYFDFCFLMFVLLRKVCTVVELSAHDSFVLTTRNVLPKSTVEGTRK